MAIDPRYYAWSETPRRHSGVQRRRQDWRVRARSLPLLAIPLLTLSLGLWQVRRRAWKLDLIDRLEAQAEREDLPLPPRLDRKVVEESDEFEYRRCRVEGRWDHAREMLVGPRTREGQIGYHLVTPLQRQQPGGRSADSILVNRGFIARPLKEPENRPASRQEGEVQVRGLLRKEAKKSIFQPENKPGKGEWYTMDHLQMAKYADTAPILLDAVFDGHAGEVASKLQAGVPVGRSSHIELRNTHAVYAATWFSLSAATSLLLWRLLRGGAGVGSARSGPSRSTSTTAARGYHTMARLRPRHRQPTPAVVHGRGFLSAVRDRLDKLFKPTPPKLERDNLFHPLSRSPFPEIRARADAIRRDSRCPVTSGAITFDCPTCGWPTHSSQEAWSRDREHNVWCATLREVNEDEHDLRSGREMVEFEFPGNQPYEQAVSLSTWDTFLFTRSFPTLDDPRPLRHVSKVLTHPITIGGVLHENSPYSLRNGRLTRQGLGSLAALRTTCHPISSGSTVKLLREIREMRIFLLGARAESSLPKQAWMQLAHLFPNTAFHLYLIGPEANFPADPPADASPALLEKQKRAAQVASAKHGVDARSTVVSDHLTVTALRAYWHDVVDQFAPFDLWTDVFFVFCPGFGYPAISTGAPAPSREADAQQTPNPGAQTLADTDWSRTLPAIIRTKCLCVFSAFSAADLERDIDAFERVVQTYPPQDGEFDWAITPGDNVFKSQRWEVPTWDVRDAVRNNEYIWAIRGRRYEVEERRSEGRV